MISFIMGTFFLLTNPEEESSRFSKRDCVLFPNETSPGPGILIVTPCKHQISRNVKASDIVYKILYMLTKIWEKCRYNQLNENLDIFALHWILLEWHTKAKEIKDAPKTLYKIEQYIYYYYTLLYIIRIIFVFGALFKDNGTYVCMYTTSQVIFVSCWQTVNAVNMENGYLKT
jgi:hypothetical protein